MLVISSGERVEVIDSASQLAPGDLGRVASEGNQLVAKRRLRRVRPGAARRRFDGQPDQRRRAIEQQLETARTDPKRGGHAHQ
jgi:hypothetical protein